MSHWDNYLSHSECFESFKWPSFGPPLSFHLMLTRRYSLVFFSPRSLMQSFNEASKVLGIIYNYQAYTAKNGCLTYTRAV